MVDTAVIGNTGGAADLGAIALGSVLFGFVYWSFGFLRMGTTGFTAQASGAGDGTEVRAALGRALLIAGIAGSLLIALQAPIATIAFSLLGASAEVESITRAYFDIRIWGAPATLGTFAILGSLVGLGRTRHVLLLQLVLNGLNATLDVVLAGWAGLGVPGIAMGTAIAEWTTLGVGLLLLRRLLEADDPAERWIPWGRVLNRRGLVATLSANGDIMVRTLFLVLGFAWFTNEGARFGDTTLAANHILFQLVTTTAYLLDGYAHATEVLVGRAVGARDRRHFDAAVRVGAELAAVSAVVLGGLLLFGGGTAISLLTSIDEVRSAAGAFLPWATLYVLLSFAAFHLDGIYIGAVWTRPMRNASVVSALGFIGLTTLTIPAAENHGLWAAFVTYVVLRAAFLLIPYRALRERALSG